MRLIDVGELEKQIAGMTIKNHYSVKRANALCKLLDEQPTAFDVDKVVEQLKELKMRYFLTIANTGDAYKDCAYKNIANTIDKAIEIVKGGENK